jgi:hypothetical protein
VHSEVQLERSNAVKYKVPFEKETPFEVNMEKKDISRFSSVDEEEKEI